MEGLKREGEFAVVYSLRVGQVCSIFTPCVEPGPVKEKEKEEVAETKGWPDGRGGGGGFLCLFPRRPLRGYPLLQPLIGRRPPLFHPHQQPSCPMEAPHTPNPGRGCDPGGKHEGVRKGMKPVRLHGFQTIQPPTYTDRPYRNTFRTMSI